MKIRGTDFGLGRHFGPAWLGLTAALGLHVGDEAAHDFLSTYNPAAAAVRARFAWLPLPTFTFAEWMAGLVAALALLLLLSPLAFRGSRWLARIAGVLALLMAANALGHLGSSWYLDRPMPGVWSSPLLLVASAWLLVAGRRTLHGGPPPGAAASRAGSSP